MYLYKSYFRIWVYSIVEKTLGESESDGEGSWVGGLWERDLVVGVDIKNKRINMETELILTKLSSWNRVCGVVETGTVRHLRFILDLLTDYIYVVRTIFDERSPIGLKKRGCTGVLNRRLRFLSWYGPQERSNLRPFQERRRFGRNGPPRSLPWCQRTRIV